MTTKNSLMGVSVANRLLEKHDTAMSGGPHINRHGPNYVTHTQGQIIWRGRFCTIKGERSGGYVLSGTVDITGFEHTSRGKSVTKRLRPGWTNKTLQRAAHRIYMTLVEDIKMLRFREHVYRIAESHDIDIDYVDKIAKAEGREIAYDDMSIADCEFWKIELAKFPFKTAEC